MDALARRRPLLIVFEDVHWIDPTTLELLARVERLPVLLLATYRPEFHPSWVGQAHVTVLALSRLGRRDGAALVQRLAGNLTGLADDIVDEIVEPIIDGGKAIGVVCTGSNGNSAMQACLSRQLPRWFLDAD